MLKIKVNGGCTTTFQSFSMKRMAYSSLQSHVAVLRIFSTCTSYLEEIRKSRVVLLGESQVGMLAAGSLLMFCMISECEPFLSLSQPVSNSLWLTVFGRLDSLVVIRFETLELLLRPGLLLWSYSIVITRHGIYMWVAPSLAVSRGLTAWQKVVRKKETAFIPPLGLLGSLNYNNGENRSICGQFYQQFQ